MHVNQGVAKVALRPPSQRLRASGFRPAISRRQHSFKCRAQERSSATTDIRKIDTEKGGLVHTLQETVLTPAAAVPVALGVGGALLAGYGQDGALIGTCLIHELLSKNQLHA